MKHFDYMRILFKPLCTYFAIMNHAEQQQNNDRELTESLHYDHSITSSNN